MKGFAENKLKTSEYDQEMPQSHTTHQHMTPQGKTHYNAVAKQQEHNEVKQSALTSSVR